MKKLLIPLVIFSQSTFSMEEEYGGPYGWTPIALQGYLKLLPPELIQSLHHFLVTVDLPSIYSLEQFLNELQEAKDMKEFSSLAHKLDKQLYQLKEEKKYNNSIKKVKELSQDKTLGPLFHDPYFNRIIINNLVQKSQSRKTPIEVARELDTPGAHAWVKELELIEAATEGDSKKVNNLLAQGVTINAQDQYGWTPLMIAVEKNHKDIVQLLIDKGANVNAQAIYDTTALMIANQKDHKDIIDLLKKHGAK